MGQKKIKVIGLDEEITDKAKKTKQKQTKTAPKKAKTDKASDKATPAVKTEAEKEVKKKAAPRKKKKRSRRYRDLRTKIDRKKLYSFQKAVELLTKIANSQLDETVEVHISTRIDKLSGKVNLPHGSGKKQKIVIANDKIIDQVSKGKIDFDILLASPSMMGKIAKVAKVLGPKGLMPNPKDGTITDNPEALKKKLSAGESRFKTEHKFPLLHVIIGKISFGPEKLLENLKALIKAIEKKNIKRATLTSTHSPGIKLQISKDIDRVS